MSAGGVLVGLCQCETYEVAPPLAPADDGGVLSSSSGGGLVPTDAGPSSGSSGHTPQDDAGAAPSDAGEPADAGELVDAGPACEPFTVSGRVCGAGTVECVNARDGNLYESVLAPERSLEDQDLGGVWYTGRVLPRQFELTVDFELVQRERALPVILLGTAPTSSSQVACQAAEQSGGVALTLLRAGSRDFVLLFHRSCLTVPALGGQEGGPNQRVTVTIRSDGETWTASGTTPGLPEGHVQGATLSGALPSGPIAAGAYGEAGAVRVFSTRLTCAPALPLGFLHKAQQLWGITLASCFPATLVGRKAFGYRGATVTGMSQVSPSGRLAHTERARAR